MASESMLRRYVCVSGNCGGLAEGCWFCGRGFSPSVSFGAAFQSMIETSAVCLKADRQTNKFAAFVPESVGFAPAGRGLQAAVPRLNL